MGATHFPALDRHYLGDEFGSLKAKMGGLARIVCPDGELMVPAWTAYDVEVLLDHVQWYARRYSGVHMRLESSAWWFVMSCVNQDPMPCSLCRSRVPDLIFVNGSHMQLCSRCAKSQLEASLKRWPWHAWRSRPAA
jgi:hypothetical protein